MMFGEHSVLRGSHAIILAIDQRLKVTLQPRLDRLISINSILGQHVTSLDKLTVQPPFHYVLQTLRDFPPVTGLTITITSEMSPIMGFGTSSAMVVALLGGLMALTGDLTMESDREQLFANALKVVRQVQGMGSGADIMASIKGGVGFYRNGDYQPLALGVELFAAYSGSKTLTTEVVNHVTGRFLAYPALLHQLDSANDVLTKDVAKYLSDANRLGELFNISAGLMEAFGVHTQALADFLWTLRCQSHGVKLSGSGLGDCAIGVVKNGTRPEGSFKLLISSRGLEVEVT